VIGNPPYVRQELIPEALLTEYRARFETLYDRADLYVPFIERSLSLLRAGGALGFICSDRWMKNKYGGPFGAWSPMAIG
jgi:methylase of polypeptide subunit release factors